MRSVEKINIKNRTYHFFNDMINIKSFDPNKIVEKINEKSYKNIFTYHIGYITVKILSYIKINSGNPLYLIIGKMNGYIEERNGNKYLTLVLSDKRKHTPKKYKEIWSKI